MITSYHVHSNFSDGRNTIPEIISAASSIKLDEIGISDHLVMLPDNKTVSWSIAQDNIPNYFDAIQHASESAPKGLNVRAGMEIDYVPETIDRIQDVINSSPLDYVIGSIHFFKGFSIDECREVWDAISEAERNDIIRGYWSMVTAMARTGLFNIVGHMDLYKKFGHLPTVDISEDIITALDAIAESKMTVEFNTSGWWKPVAEAYPSSMILQGCIRRGIPILITADAHFVSELNRDFDRATTVLANMGSNSTVVYSRRKAHIIGTD